MILLFRMERTQAKLLPMFTCIYIQNILKTLFRGLLIVLDHRRIWGDSAKSIKDCFSKELNEMFRVIFQINQNLEMFLIIWFEYIENIIFN